MSASLEQSILDLINVRDGPGLSRSAVEDPIRVLTFVDGVMRGLVAGPLDADTLEWLEGLDIQLRRWLALNNRMQGGPSELDLDAEILRGAYMHGSLYLVAGAGVSMEAGISGWKDLVMKVLHTALADNGGSPDARRRAERVLEELRGSKTYASETLLEATEAAHAVFGSSFHDRLRHIIYGGHAINHTETHRAISRMVRPKTAPIMPRVFSILTYNFDDLLETSIWKSGWNFNAWCSVRGEWRFQYDRNRKPDSLAIDIYHLHGYVPREANTPEGVDLVFSTDAYRRMYGEDRSFTNVIARSHLQNALGLVIGSSLRDSYAVQQWQQVRKPGWYNYVMMSLPDERTKEYYRELGLRVIWMDDFSAIRKLLNRIHGGAAV